MRRAGKDGIRGGQQYFQKVYANAFESPQGFA